MYKRGMRRWLDQQSHEVRAYGERKKLLPTLLLVQFWEVDNWYKKGNGHVSRLIVLVDLLVFDHFPSFDMYYTSAMMVTLLPVSMISMCTSTTFIHISSLILIYHRHHHINIVIVLYVVHNRGAACPCL